MVHTQVKRGPDDHRLVLLPAAAHEDRRRLREARDRKAERQLDVARKDEGVLVGEAALAGPSKSSAIGGGREVISFRT